MYETYATVTGTVISTISKRQTLDGTAVAGFRMASNERRRDRVTAEWTDGESFYVSVTCWRRLAEGVHQSLVRGDPIVVLGKIYTRSYEKDGVRHSVTEMEAVAVGPDLGRCTAAVTRANRANSSASVAVVPELGSGLQEGPQPAVQTASNAAVEVGVSV